MADADPKSLSEETPVGGSAVAPPKQNVEEDSDPDFDDLDDVLDQFDASSASKPTSATTKPTQPTPSTSGPGRPHDDAPSSSSTAHYRADSGAKPGESEEDFMSRLNAEMSTLVASMETDAGKQNATADEVAKMGKELEAFTSKMEADGVKPEDLLRAILGEEDAETVVDAAKEQKHKIEAQEDLEKARSRSAAKSEGPAAAGSAAGKKQEKAAESFEDTIRKTMSRMQESDKNATEATTSGAGSEEDMLAQLMKAMEAGGGGDGSSEDGDLSKMFLGMMEQLTNKDMLYEPMAELNTKFPDYLRTKGKSLPQGEKTRFENQAAIVKEIVAKFEEKGYSDDKPDDRAYIWERMQKMQEQGAPPDELVSNPFPGMGGLPGMGGGGEDAQCPTQ